MTPKIVGWAQSRSGMPDISGMAIYDWGIGNFIAIDGIKSRGDQPVMVMRIDKKVFEAEAIRYLTEHGYKVKP